MRRPIFTNREMETANPAEFGLEAVQGTAMFRPLGATIRLPRPVIWPMDAQRRPASYYQRPPADGASGSYPRRQVVEGAFDDCEASGSIYLVAVRAMCCPPSSTVTRYCSICAQSYYLRAQPRHPIWPIT